MMFEDILTSVLPWVEGCPDTVALDHIKKAARGFCARTLVWNYSCRPISATSALATYTVLIGEHEEMVRMLRCEVNGTAYQVPNPTLGRSLVRSLSGHICAVGGNNDFTLSPAPWQDGVQIITDVAVKPTMTATIWPDDLSEHVEAIAAGAVATLCAIPKKEWSDSDAAARKLGEFNDRVGTIAIKTSKGLGRERAGSAVTWY